MYSHISILARQPYSLVDCHTKDVVQPKCINRELKRALDQYSLSMSEDLLVHICISYCFVFQTSTARQTEKCHGKRSKAFKSNSRA